MEKHYLDKLNHASECLIASVFKTLKTLNSKVNSDSVYVLYLYPYLALFFRETQE